MRYSRTLDGPKYLSSTAVVMSELVKFTVCLAVHVYTESKTRRMTFSALWNDVFGKEVCFLYTYSSCTYKSSSTRSSSHQKHCSSLVCMASNVCSRNSLLFPKQSAIRCSDATRCSHLSSNISNENPNHSTSLSTCPSLQATHSLSFSSPYNYI